MEPTRSDQILDEWSSVARSATPPGPPPHAATTGVAGAGISLAGAAVLVVALVAAFAVLGNRPSQSGPAGLPTASPSPSPSVAVAIPAPPTPEPTSTSHRRRRRRRRRRGDAAPKSPPAPARR